MGRGPQAPRHHQRVLRSLHAGHRHQRLRDPRRQPRPRARLPRRVPRMSAPAGELAIVLHTHMPYVEGGGDWPPADEAAFIREPYGFGRWPFGEEWLWEAIATSYVPLLDVLGRAPITLSLTPVLCDQLAAPGATDRCARFLTEIRTESHRRDVAAFRESGQDELVAELERSAAEYASAAERLTELPGGILGAFAEHVSWTS